MNSERTKRVKNLAVKRELPIVHLLGVVGVSGVVASMFSPARNHGAIDVVAISAATSAYAYLTTSIVLPRLPRPLAGWLTKSDTTLRAERWSLFACGLSAAAYLATIWIPITHTLRRLDPHGPHVPTVPAAIVAAFGLGVLLLLRFHGLGGRFARLVSPLTVVVFLAATVQFASAAKLLVTLTGPHGFFMIACAAIGLATLSLGALSGPTSVRERGCDG